MKILLTGGGSAGHVWPIIFVAQKLQAQNHKILYIGARQGIERNIVKNFQLPFKAIVCGKRRTYFSWLNFWDFVKTIAGLIQVFFILITYRPQAIFAKGGYVTTPILFWARVFRIPLVIHESDSVFGRANFWASKFARKICVGFPTDAYDAQIAKEKMEYTGIPIDPRFRSQSGSQNNLLPSMLITGGSQGSSKINDLIKKILPALVTRYEIYHVTGTKDYRQFANFKSDNYHPFEFSYEMPKLMNKCDIVISRAGATTIAEIAATAKPAILIPLSSAAGDHQNHNAKYLQNTGAAIIFDETTLTLASLKKQIEELINNKDLQAKLSNNIKRFDKEDAIEMIASIIASFNK